VLDTNSPASQVRIENFHGDGYFIQTAEPIAPSIPVGADRLCPQCGRETFARARWCWYRDCAHDFDRAAIPRINPSKLLWISTLANAVLCFILGFVLFTAHNV
jgi:hypothetical protein